VFYARRGENNPIALHNGIQQKVIRGGINKQSLYYWGVNEIFCLSLVDRYVQELIYIFCDILLSLYYSYSLTTI
jgi:hypothetical protein